MTAEEETKLIGVTFSLKTIARIDEYLKILNKQVTVKRDQAKRQTVIRQAVEEKLQKLGF